MTATAVSALTSDNVEVHEAPPPTDKQANNLGWLQAFKLYLTRRGFEHPHPDGLSIEPDTGWLRIELGPGRIPFRIVESIEPGHAGRRLFELLPVDLYQRLPAMGAVQHQQLAKLYGHIDQARRLRLCRDCGCDDLHACMTPVAGKAKTYQACGWRSHFDLGTGYCSACRDARLQPLPNPPKPLARVL